MAIAIHLGNLVVKMELCVLYCQICLPCDPVVNKPEPLPQNLENSFGRNVQIFHRMLAIQTIVLTQLTLHGFMYFYTKIIAAR
ncbi:MAG: hypothetical protein ABIO19_04390 [Burkholderiaceae bacterium]